MWLIFVFVFANISPNICIRVLFANISPNICIRICPFLSARIYSYLDSPFFINPNIFVFVFVLDMETKFINICISLHNSNRIPSIAYYGTYIHNFFSSTFIALIYNSIFILGPNICICIHIRLFLLIQIRLYSHSSKKNWITIYSHLYLPKKKGNLSILVFVFGH